MRNNPLILVILCLLLSACTQKAQDVASTLNEAFFGFADSKQTAEEINALPYASSHVIIDDGAQIFMVLALAEPSNNNPLQTRLKWLSSDRAMFITENGRLIKTLRLPTNNLADITSENKADPLTIKGPKPTQYKWTAKYDWQPDYRFNYTADLTWQFIKSVSVRSATWEKQTDYYQEKVTFPALGAQFINHFWLDKTTHQVVKSIQHLGPDMSSVEMTLVKPFSG